MLRYYNIKHQIIYTYGIFIKEKKMTQKNYDYRSEVLDDVMNYLTNEIGLAEVKTRIEEDADAFAEELNDTLWMDDSVTGNGFGSYWFNAYKAEEALCHNFDLYLEAEQAFGGDLRTMAKSYSPETADVTIRCYLLREAIDKAIEDIRNNEF